jgi:glycosyltransferase involved in cell wall biosynthesis
METLDNTKESSPKNDAIKFAEYLGKSQQRKIEVSIIVPLFNEEGSVRKLHKEITAACKRLDVLCEVIFVNDGSTDRTEKIAATLPNLTLISFRKNFGQTAAFDAGIKRAQGRIIVTMDGDLQNDPKDISKLLKKIEEGYDVVSGWRWQRKDPLAKRITSRTANLLRKVFFKDSIHDSGCALKAYRRECFRHFDLFGEMHRFIPALLESRGFRVTEVKVSHRPRTSGVSKYGNFGRGVKSIVDMASVWFWSKFSSRPAHLFGGIGLVLALVGGSVLMWMFVERVVFDDEIASRIWPLLGTSLLIAGIQFSTFGILSDILIKTYYSGARGMNYLIKDITINT